MSRAYVSIEQTWQVDDDAIIRDFPDEWLDAQTDGKTRDEFIRESAAILAEWVKDRPPYCILASEEFDVDWES